MRYRISLNFDQEEDGSCVLPGYEVRGPRGEVLALGVQAIGGPRYPSVELACRAAYDAAIVALVRNGVQEAFPDVF